MNGQIFSDQNRDLAIQVHSKILYHKNQKLKVIFIDSENVPMQLIDKNWSECKRIECKLS